MNYFSRQIRKPYFMIRYLISLFGLCISLLIFSCSKEKADLYFKNDVDCIVNWGIKVPSNYIRFENAFSGNFVTKIDSLNPYSQTLDIRLSDVSEVGLTRVVCSARVLLPDFNSSPDLVVEIRDSLQNVLEWLPVKVIDFTDEENVWFQATNEVNLISKNLNKPSNFVRVYVSSGASSAVFVDDIEVNFY